MQACSCNHLTATSKHLQYTHVTDIAIMLALRLWGSWILPARTLDVYSFFNKQAKATELGDFS